MGEGERFLFEVGPKLEAEEVAEPVCTLAGQETADEVEAAVA